MKRKKYVEELKKLKGKHGSMFKKFYRTRRNYPYGKNSLAEYSIELK